VNRKVKLHNFYNKKINLDFKILTFLNREFELYDTACANQELFVKICKKKEKKKICGKFGCF
jgi:hypothetical protein